MSEFLLVLGIASLTAAFTYLGVPLAEKVEVSGRVIGAALQVAAGILTAIVAFTLMPRAVQNAPSLFVVLAFFVGGALFILMEYLSAQRQLAQPAMAATTYSLGLYLGVLVDMAIDGIAIGVGSTLTLGTGLLLAVGLALSTAPLAFVTIATAKREGVPPDRRRQLSILFVVAIVGGAALGYVGLRNQPVEVKLILIALVSGFLITLITQSMIPGANREAESSYSGIYFVGGLSLFALLSLTLK